MKPYKDIQNTSNQIIREFDENINQIHLMWHRDKESREVEVLEGDGWYFQKDNELPLELKKNDKIYIPKYLWHRLIKGTTNLKIKICKM